jgi:hypothetical protein
MYFTFETLTNQPSPSMITYMLLTILVLAIAGLVILHSAIKSSPKGFEDDYGFHEDLDAQPDSTGDLVSVVHAVVVEQVSELPNAGAYTRRALEQAVRDTLDPHSHSPRTS